MKWIPAVVTKVMGSMCYEVLVNGIKKKVHIDQMIKNQTNITENDKGNTWDFNIEMPRSTSSIGDDSVSERRYPNRTRLPPVRYGYP